MQKSNAAKKAYGYIRVSTATHVREGESIAVQQELIETICKLEGLTLETVFIEDGVSGSKPLSSRPAGRKLLAAAQAGDVIVALRLDRVFRNTSDALATLADFKRKGVLLYLKDVGGFVSGDSVGELVFSLMSSVASFERSRTRERILEVRHSMRNQGRYMGGDTPFGYQLVEDGGKTYIAPDAAVLAQVRDLKGKGYSTRLISGYFAQQGIKVSHHAVARYLRRSTI